MKFHLPSYVLGVVTGASGAALAKRLRPLAVEIAAGAYTVADAIGVRIARGRENLSDLLAEARARARSKLQPVLHTVGA
jgi:hypothetical protein